MRKKTLKIKAMVSATPRTIPYIFSFITFRRERFGALLFNPCLGFDIEMDAVEAYIAGLYDGSRSYQAVEAAVQKRFRVTSFESHRLVKNVTKKLAGMGALGLREDSIGASPKSPAKIEYPASAPYLSAPKSVTWEVTSLCNLNCPHCFTNAGGLAGDELSTAQALQVIDRLDEARVFSVLLSGGEPLLRPDIFTVIGGLAARNIRVELGTNGQTMTQKRLKKLGDTGVACVHVSIDGIGNRHDRFRGKKGSFEIACETIRKLREKKIRVNISTTVTARNIGDIERIIGLALELKCNGFNAIPFFPVGRGKKNEAALKLDTDSYYRLYKLIAEKKRELRGRLNIKAELCFPFLFEESMSLIDSSEHMGCAAGYDTLCIDAGGIAYPCPYLRDFPLGNVLEKSLADIWEGAPVLDLLGNLRKSDFHDPCQSCGYAPILCKGGCRAMAYLVHGDLKAGDPTCVKSMVRE